MNLPNKLTVSRFYMAGIFTALLLSRQPYTNLAALMVFVVAMITDYLDGKIARERKLTSNFGILMDPLADKVINSAAFICFVSLDRDILGVVGPWAVIIIVTREFLVTGLRLLGMAQNRVLAADSLGKHKTAWQMITILVILVYLTFWELFPLNMHPKLHMEYKADFHEWIEVIFFWLIRSCLIITVALTIYSGWAYLWKNRALWVDDVDLRK